MSLLLEASSWLRSQSLVAGVQVLEGNPKSSPAGATHLKVLGSPALNTGSLAANNPRGWSLPDPKTGTWKTVSALQHQLVK